MGCILRSKASASEADYHASSTIAAAMAATDLLPAREDDDR